MGRPCASLLLLLALASLLASPALAWGPLGHWLTGAIGQRFLSPASANAVANLLPEVGGDMAAVASWADSVARQLYPWSPQLHYINSPDWACNYDRSRDCHGEHGEPMACVDGAIQNFTKQLVSGNAPLSLNVALKFVVHFCGDIHQPLHVGFTSDEGGNTISGTWDGRYHRKLHELWDTTMLEQRLAQDFAGNNDTYLNYLVTQVQSGVWAGETDEWRQCPSTDPSTLAACSQAWAQNSVTYACSTAYVDQDGNKIQNGFSLGDDYYRFALPVVEQQVAKGGVRLANVLNHLFAQESMRVYTLPPQRFRRVRRHMRQAGIKQW